MHSASRPVPEQKRLDKEENKKFYNTQRPDERRRFVTEPSKIHAAELLVPWLLQHLPSSGRMADIGGGSGTYASAIASNRAIEVVGIDISASMVQQRSEDPLLPLNVVGDMEAVPLASGEFDAVLFAACLHHVPDPRIALREAWRILRPGGRLFAFEPLSLKAIWSGSLPIPDEPHEFRFSLAWLTGRIEEAGFTTEEVRGHRVTMRFLQRIVREPPLRAYRITDALDRVLCTIPGVERLGSLGMLRAVKKP
jgi:SAM-dependent methyltransferase